jgi:hypothetical protein
MLGGAIAWPLTLQAQQGEMPRTPGLIEDRKLNGELTTHNLIKLADKAAFPVHAQERLVLEALSQLSVWAGR